MNRLRVPKKIYFKRGSMPVALRELSEIYGCRKALLVSDANLYKLRIIRPVEEYLKRQEIRTAEYFDLSEDPTFDDAMRGLAKMQNFQPDVIIGVGGGSVMSMAKIMWLLYENPDIDLEKMAEEHSVLPEEESGVPLTGKKAMLVLAATTTGTGVECSPFAAAKDAAGKKRLIASYDLLPEMAIVDADYTGNMSDKLTRACGRNTFVRAVDACLTENASDYTRGFAGDAVRLVLENLPRAIKPGAEGADAKEKMATASVLAGMAVANSMRSVDPDMNAKERINACLDISTAEKRDILAGIARFAGYTGTNEEALSAWIRAVDIIEIM